MTALVTRLMLRSATQGQAVSASVSLPARTAERGMAGRSAQLITRCAAAAALRAPAPHSERPTVQRSSREREPEQGRARQGRPVAEWVEQRTGRAVGGARRVKVVVREGSVQQSRARVTRQPLLSEG